jgi:GT2 family glycosyltransferase
VTDPGGTVEIVVVDDASPGAAPGELERMVAGVPGARLLVNEVNLGFLATANRGAAETTGEILVLLNDDTVVLPDWLPQLVRTFREHPDAGVVGGRLLHPDGRLQEAGGSVFRDGSAMKFGYGDRDPDAPLYTFLREVDYVSGAFLATPRALFRDLDGLDPDYGFGFYEDTDYCFRVRRSLRRVLYQPGITIIHVEGGTVGTDTGEGHKRAQVENQARFRGRWDAELRERPERPRTVRPEDWYAVAVSAMRPPVGTG